MSSALITGSRLFAPGFSSVLHQSARILGAGGILAYPTETVYGLGCDPLNEQAVRRICHIKKRPLSKGLILLAAELDQLLPFVELTHPQYQQLRDQWPYGTTFLIKATDAVPYWVSGGSGKVAVRVSQHPLASRLSLIADTPLVSTSANISGRPACRNYFLAHRHFQDKVDAVVDGECGKSGKASSIIDLDTGQQLR